MSNDIYQLLLLRHQVTQCNSVAIILNHNTLSMQMGRSATIIKVLTNCLSYHCTNCVFTTKILFDQLIVHIKKIIIIIMITREIFY